jgi:hypothetical protein
MINKINFIYILKLYNMVSICEVYILDTYSSFNEFCLFCMILKYLQCLY